MPHDLISRLERAGRARKYGDFYLVCDNGRIFSRGRGRWRLLTGHPTKKGYIRHWLRINGVTRECRLNRVVAECFVGPSPFEGAVARHLDGDITNNSADNILWGSSSDNARDAVRHGTSTAAANGRASAHKLRGELSVSAKLTWVAVREIRKRRIAGETYPIIASDYGVDQSTIYQICKNKTWVESDAALRAHAEKEEG